MPVEEPPSSPAAQAAVEPLAETPPPREPVPVMAAHTAPVPFTVVPSPPTHAESAEEQPYDRLDCPACGTIFRDLPDAVADCPACGSTIHVLTCPEGVRHLLTDADVAAFDDDWEALHATRRREEAQRRNAAALQARRAALASYGELGVRLVDLRTTTGGVCGVPRGGRTSVPSAGRARAPDRRLRTRHLPVRLRPRATVRHASLTGLASRLGSVGPSQTQTPGDHWQADRSPGVSMRQRPRGR